MPDAAAELSVVARPLSDPAVEELWCELQSGDGVPCPFLLWEWMSSLRDEAALSANVEVLIVESGEDPVALLPLEWGKGPDGTRAVGFAPYGWASGADYDIVTTSEMRYAAAFAIVEYLHARRDWDLLDLFGLRAASPLVVALLTRLRRPRYFVRFVEADPAPFLHVEPAAGMGAVPRGSLRRNARGDMRKAEQAGGEYSVFTDFETARPMLAETMDLHAERHRGESELFTSGPARSFHARAFARLAESDAALLTAIHIGDVIEASNWHIRFDDKLVYYVAAWQEGELHSPGQTLLSKDIEWASETEVPLFDLGSGDHPWKMRFAQGVRTDYWLKILRASPRSSVSALRHLLAARRAT